MLHHTTHTRETLSLHADTPPLARGDGVAEHLGIRGGVALPVVLLGVVEDVVAIVPRAPRRLGEHGAGGLARHGRALAAQRRGARRSARRARAAARAQVRYQARGHGQQRAGRLGERPWEEATRLWRAR
eukprot:scaffold19219_cov52-Phaeocystis_antarctica.AAC.4